MFTGRSVKGNLPPLASGSRTFRKILAVPSSSAFCRFSYFLKTPFKVIVTIPKAPTTTCVTITFTRHYRATSLL